MAPAAAAAEATPAPATPTGGDPRDVAEYKGCGPCRHRTDGGLLKDDDRKCRDLLCGLIFAGFWVIGIAIAAVGFSQGNPLTLIYGLDYAGDVCNRNGGQANNLRGYPAMYWVNPNQVMEATGYGFNLADATSICLGSCPALLPGGNLSWVCKYPQNADGSYNVNASAVPDLAAWAARNYDYFALLNASAVASSCQLQGPCWPVVTSNVDSFHICNYAQLTNLPLNAQTVTGLQQCFNCCSNPSAPVCSATTVGGVPTVYDFTGNASSANGYVACLDSCQTLHASIDALTAETSGTIFPPAYLQYQLTCATKTGVSPAPIPAPKQDDGALNQVVNALVSSQRSVAERYAGDVVTVWKALVVTGLFLPILLSFLYLVLLRVLVAPIVYTTLVLCDLAVLGCTLYCFAKAGFIPGAATVSGVVGLKNGTVAFNATAANLVAQQSALTAAGYNNQTAALSFNTSASAYASVQDVAHNAKLQMYYLGIFSALCTVIFWVGTAVMVPRLRVAIATIKVACKTMQAVPSLLAYPLFGAFWTVAFVIWWVIAGVFIYSSGKIVKRNCCGQVQAAFQSLYPGVPAQLVPSCASISCGYTVQMNKPLEYALIYHGFEFLWTTEFIVAFGQLVVAQVAFFFYCHEGVGRDMPLFPVLHAINNTARYYMGSAALGSFLVATIQAIRIAVAYIESKAKKLEEGNPVVKLLFACIQCMLLCLQKLVEWLNKNTYAVIAVDGTSFCESAVKAVKLILTNSGRIGTVTMSEVVLLLGRVTVAAVCTFFCFVYVEKQYPPGTVSSPILPVIIVFFVSFAIASVFFSLVETCIGTTIIAFCDDCDRNGGEPKHSPQVLMDAVGCHFEVQKAVAEGAAGGGGCCGKRKGPSEPIPKADVEA